MAAVLFGKPISAEIASKTCKQFESRDVHSPDKILATGRNGLVEILDAGGYIQYDYSTATKLLNLTSAGYKVVKIDHAPVFFPSRRI